MGTATLCEDWSDFKANNMLADPSAKVLVDRLKYCKAIGKELRKEKCP
jgi:hypothetical protein